MMWTRPQDLRVQLTRLWERGELLRDVVTGNIRFPLRLTLKSPSSADITGQFDAVRIWVAELTRVNYLHVEWREVHHRVQGSQKLPASVWIDSIDDALNWLDKRSDWQRFSRLLEITRQQHPLLLPWLEKRPLQALMLAAEWSRLLAIVDWIVRHPRPAIYLRQLDVPGVHSKFIEAHRTVLAELLDLVLLAGNVDPGQTGIARFAARYGFLEKPVHIRFRPLDPQIRLIDGLSRPDVALDADSFSRLAVNVQHVFITENEINFLTLPDIPAAMAIFGSGYGWEALARALWLERCAIYYWGDIDTHGFAILDQLRSHFPHTVSLLMDRATLEAHRAFWGYEDKPLSYDLLRLTPEEANLYDDLRDNRIRKGLRLEQEHLGFGWVRERIDQLL